MLRRAARALGLGLTLAACADRTPADFADCADLDCQRRWVTARWKEEPDSVAQAVKQIDDPLVRVALVRAVSDAFPATTKALCELLPGGPEREACEKQNQRPHLRQVQVSSTEWASTAQDTEVNSFALSRALPNPWREVAPEAAGCAAEDRACLDAAAKARAGSGDARGAAAACAAITSPLWRAECMFQAAETATDGTGAVSAQAGTLCLGASDLLGRCLEHVVKRTGQRAPRAGSSTDGERWARLAEAITGGAAALASTDADLALQLEDHGWAFALRVAYAQESAPNGAPLAVIPERASPHLRASLAWRLWALEGTQGRDLAAWQARLAEALADRSTYEAPRRPIPDLSQAVARLWEPLPGEEALPQIPWLGPARRTLGEDEPADLLICLLEAAARSEPLAEPLFAEALKHPSARVRWTAARLLSAVKPSSRVLVKGDRDPLVRARLRSP